MKNKELIAILQQLDPEKEVMKNQDVEYVAIDSIKEIDVCAIFDNDPEPKPIIAII